MATNNDKNAKLIEIIHEKTANLEQTNNITTVTQTLDKLLAKLGKVDKENSNSTITIKKKQGELEHNTIRDTIEQEWIDKRNQTPPTFWQDKTNTYCQFINEETKTTFIEHIKRKSNFATLKENILNLNSEQNHYNKMPIKFELNNVRGNIKAQTIENILKTNLGSNSKLFDYKEGKTDDRTKNKTISFKGNSSALKDIIERFKWTVPYTNRATDTRTKLYIKINAKPWLCKECYTIGHHQCPGKSCAKCGNKEHVTKDCQSATKFCTSCKQKGHRARDQHCPKYLKQLAKNLIKMDLPQGILENSRSRQEVIDNIQIK